MSKVHWLALSAVPGIGGVTARRLADKFGGAAKVFDASVEELVAVPRITPEIAAALQDVSFDDFESAIDDLSGDGIQVVTWEDDEYPANLRLADDAPPLLFMLGELSDADENAIAIIGTREPSAQSAEFATDLARELAARGVTIVSGLAAGIDTAAHQGALQADGGRTLAVLGSGVRVIHPRENRNLAEAVVGHGVLMSEFQPNTPPSGPNLMMRDRVISGLSKAVIVVEAGVRSGSMDTAIRARKQGRIVFAVPGSPGTDDLILSGAEVIDPANADVDQIIARLSESMSEKPDQLTMWG
jgi:DNA processing protein